MPEFKIEKGVILPAMYGQYSRYPFEEMKVGDSFKIADGNLAQAVRMAAAQYSKRHDKSVKFTVRKHQGIYRCWKVK